MKYYLNFNSTFATVLLADFFIFFSLSCQPNKGTDMSTIAFLLAAQPSYAEFLNYSGNNVILPTLQDLENKSLSLNTSAQNYCSDPTNTTKLANLQQAWKNARSSLKKSEVFYFGPAENPPGYYFTNLDGYEKLQRPKWNNISAVLTNTTSFPTINESSVLTYSTVRRGFEALEMLIFSSDGNDANISSSANIIAANSSNAGYQRRLDYIQALAQVIYDDARNLNTQWKSTGGNFIGNYVGGNGYFKSSKEAFDTYVTKIASLAEVTRDQKTGTPAGLSLSSAGTAHSNLTEAIFSRNAYQDLLDNVYGIEFAYIGNAGDSQAKSLSLMVQAQNSSVDANIKSAIADLKTTLQTKIAGASDLYADISAGSSTINAQVSPLWIKFKTLRTLTGTDLLSVLGVPAMPSNADGD
ncbi:imelysin [Leptospira inadai serovar Lyme str. 10]|uniref:Imelysin n=2 Tax=Leptospira inadai serovar Lyme TaxID=293084 RepID=V6I0J1_9LEPT|nr:imelysin family protein [Leptospira inadai]EQA38794.1 imelysin [Leptospira inadai serovar Lyme str. 10]PNV74084.1 imelysin [Leptospira inadai serovar Lyme]